MVSSIRKRDARIVPFDVNKIAQAIFRAASSQGGKDYVLSLKIAAEVLERLNEQFEDAIPDVEQVQDLVEKTLIKSGHARTAKAYILYRHQRTKIREMNTRLMTTIRDLTFKDAKDNDLKRENANIDGDTAMGMMLRYGSESSKQFYEMYILNPKHSLAHKNGDIHIHDLDFLSLTTTCCQIDIKTLFKGGFGTGHGFLREPNDIRSYSALACIAIQANQNDQHGGQSIPNFEYGLAPGVAKTFIKELCLILDLYNMESKDAVKAGLRAYIEENESILDEKGLAFVREILTQHAPALNIDFAVKKALEYTEKATYQAMEALVHNLNTMHSRAGAQTPFSSVNYGMDTSPEGRMVIKNMLLATEEGLGSGETPIFPVQIFRVKEGVNFNPGDPNYDLFKLAMHCSAKRLFPNFSFLDAPFNAQYYKGTPETEIAYMGCRTRVMGNVYDPDREVTPGRGNLSFTSINLPRLAIRAKGDIDLFFDLLDSKLQLVTGQLDERFEIQARKHVYNAPFLMGQGVWIDSEKLSPTDEQREVLKHGTLTTGFIGLAECLVALTGQHHGQSAEAQRLGLEIVGHMRSYCDRVSKERGMNYTLIATPAEGLSGRFVRIDRARYGVIPGVTDRDYYTNGFHVPVYFDISAYDKIALEAPYHALTNGGHISYIEMDGDPTDNLEAFESVIRYMKDCGMGYGSVNHPVDRDPVCGYNGIIEDVCPKCGRTEDAHNQPFERIRRITGYLVGTLDRFNDAKRAEEHDRVKHDVPTAE